MNKRPNNITPQVDFTALVAMFLGFKFLDDWIMYGLIAWFLVHHTLVRLIERAEEKK